MPGKISIIGCGGVGANLGFNVISRIRPKELVLVDINLGLAKGVALDLEDTRGILNFSTKIKGTNNYSNIKNSRIIVITAGIARRPGMTRLDLLRTNTKVTSDISHKIKKFAPTSVVIVVTNPLDFITYVVTKKTGFSRKRVFGMGSSLDTSRFFNIISNKADIGSLSLSGFVYGSHSKDMIVEKTKLSVSGERIDKFIKNVDFLKLKKSVQLRGAEIVKNLKT